MTHVQELVVATIIPPWAEQIADVRSRSSIAQFNGRNAEDLYDDVDLSQLGGLAVDCTMQTFSAEDVADMKSVVRSVLDLAFGQIARAAHTSDLLKAARRNPDRASFAVFLTRRLRANWHHGYDETWFLPESGLRIGED